MIDIKRKTPRFDVNFHIMANDIQGRGVNISQGGFGCLTEEQIESEEHITFDTQIHGFVFSDKSYLIKGRAELLYSIKTETYRDLFYNGFKFTDLDEISRENLLQLLEDIRSFQKSPNVNLETKSLADFYYYPSTDIFYKTKIFYEASSRKDDNRFQMFSYYLDSPSISTSRFINRKTKVEKEMIMMGSNNYLGLTTHPDVIDATIEGVKKYGTGNGAGAMVGGTLSVHKQLEEELADFIGKEEVMIFNSGYSTNLGAISGLLRPQDASLIDQASHASIYDGCNQSNAKTLIFSHNNTTSLEKVLRRIKLTYDGLLIIVDGIYSTDGTLAPLKEIHDLATQYKCRTMVDEAHSFGILGENGAGACEHFGLSNKIDIIMGTMSKSLAGVGGFIGSTKEVIEYLRFYARSYLFSTNIPPSVACSILKSLQLIREDKSIRERLLYNIDFFKKGLKSLNLNIGNPMAAVIPVFIPDLKLLLTLSEELFKKGLFHNVMAYPAVPMGGSLLRFGIMATHMEEELKKALDIIEDVFGRMNLCR